MNNTSKKLVGERVVLRHIRPVEDARDWNKYMMNPLLHEWTGNNIPVNLEETINLLEKYRDSTHMISWVIVSKETNK